MQTLYNEMYEKRHYFEKIPLITAFVMKTREFNL